MLRVLLPFSGGVLTGLYLFQEIKAIHVLVPLLILWISALVNFRWQRGKPAPHPWFLPLVLFLCLALAGAGAGIQTSPRAPGIPEGRWVMVHGNLWESPRQEAYAHEFILQVRWVCSTDSLYRTRMQLQCYLPLTAAGPLPEPGETWQFTGRLTGIRNSGNPGLPDYRAILGRKKRWFRFHITSDSLSGPLNRAVENMRKWPDPAAIRHAVSAHWKGNEQELGLLKAVCLGDRSSLNDDMLRDYRNAGGMHLLAVSGLHVGLIWWVLQYMTGWMGLIFRKDSHRALPVLAILWFYAFMTGFSSSVCRSVCMFSFLTAGRLMGERTHTLNVILASAFLLLVINPTRLTDVGFQLSYAAITGIVSLHPLALRAWRPGNRLIRWFWEAGSVSLAAQLVTAPLVIFYFRQLPVYSLLTSLVAIPLLSFLIAVFVCSLPFVSAGILEPFFSFLLTRTAGCMNRSVEFLAGMPGAVLEDLRLGPVGLFFSIAVLLLMMTALHGRRRGSRYLLLLGISCALLGSSVSEIKRCRSSELFIGHFRGASLVSFRSGRLVDHYCWATDSAGLSYAKSYIELAWNRRIYKNRVHLPEERRLNVDPPRRQETGTTGGLSCCVGLAKGLWLLQGQGVRGVVLRKTAGGQLPLLFSRDSLSSPLARPDFILLSGEPTLEGLQRHDFPEEVTLVCDGSNRAWYLEKIPEGWGNIYLTDQQGAYTKRW